MNHVMSELGLTHEQTKILFSFQYHLVAADIENETDSEKMANKDKWLKRWRKSCEDFLKSQIRENDFTSDCHLYRNYSILTLKTKEFVKTLKVRTPLYLILLETTFFTPYYPLDSDSQKNKAFKGLSFFSKEKKKEKLEQFALSLNIDKSYVDKFNKSLKESIKGITGFWRKILWGGSIGAIVIAITGGFAAPYVAELLAPIGLTGAAAISAGLATLGGGAIAAGGFGIAGGIAVVVGGGAVLGAGAGVGIGSLLSDSPDFALTQAAKLEVVMKEITLNAQKDIRIAQELIKEQINAIHAFEKQLLELKKDQVKNKKKIENLTKSIQYLRKAMERNEKLFSEATN